MTYRTITYRTILTCLILHSCIAVADAADQPNILIILADDMGYGDMQCMGSKHLQTPHLDALAQSGVLCTQAYVASSVCSPSRAGLLTGRDPRRFGYEGNLNMSAGNYATRPELLGLPPGEHTLGDHLKNAGYTTGLVGKWHQGTGASFHPNVRGFDHFCGMLGGSHSYFPTEGRNSIERNGVPVTEFTNDYLTDFFTDESIRWIESVQSGDTKRPWFLFMSYNAPHTPMQARDDDLKLFEHIKNQKRRTYAAMMFALDRGVGRVREYLNQSKQLKNTLIVFFSDNGGATSNSSWNGQLSGVKGCMKEGGIRVPMIWSWPKTIPSETRNANVVSSLDLLPTFLAAAKDAPLPLSKPRGHESTRSRKNSVKEYGEYDGINVLPMLSGKSGTQPVSRRLFWRLQGQAAILSGTDKLIRLNHRPAQLFRPATDAAEANDLYASEPERARRLFKDLAKWESNLSTVPLWGSSPFWDSQSAQNYDDWNVRPEPE